MNVVDALMISVGFDVSGFVRGTSQAQAAIDKTKREGLKAAQETERNAERALTAQMRLQERAVRATEKAANEQARAEAKAAKEAAAAQRQHGDAVGNTMRKLAGLYALFTGGRGIVEFTKYITQADSALGRFAQSIGVVPASVSALGMALERNGGSANSAAAAFQHLNDQVQAFKTGQGNSDFLRTISQLSNLGGVAIDAFAALKNSSSKSGRLSMLRERRTSA